MSLVIVTDKLVLTPPPAIPETFGLIGWANNVEYTNVSATSQTAEGPVTNVANPATSYPWIAADTADQTITITNNSQEINYIGVARHNFNQPGAEVRLRLNGVVVNDWMTVEDNQVLLYRISNASPLTIELDARGATEPFSVAVIYVGLALELQRGIYVGHTPIPFGRDRKTINGVSESGQYLGEIVIGESLSTDVSLTNLTPEWYRNYLDPIIAEKPRRPMFWAWKPNNYPAEVGFCWIEGNPRPVNARSNGMMDINWKFRGIA